MTGAAAAKFTQPGVDDRSDSQVFATAGMVQAGLAAVRSVAELPRLRSRDAEEGREGEDADPLPAQDRDPRIGDKSAAFRMIFEVKTKGGP